MRGEILDDVVGYEAADDTFLIFGLESNQLHRSLDSRRVDDGFDHAPDRQNATGQDVIIPRPKTDLAIESLRRFVASRAPVLVGAFRSRHLVMSFPKLFRGGREDFFVLPLQVGDEFEFRKQSRAGFVHLKRFLPGSFGLFGVDGDGQDGQIPSGGRGRFGDVKPVVRLVRLSPSGDGPLPRHTALNAEAIQIYGIRARR